MSDQWAWDETLYRGSARFYPVGRVAYPRAVADVLRDELGLDGTGRLLDVGCGPGSLSLLLAPLFASVVGVDADPDMVTTAAELARRSGVDNAAWVCMRAEDLPGDLASEPGFQVITLAQSFHWLDRERVASAALRMLAPGGVWVHVHATTHRGVDGADQLAHPRPPWQDISALVTRYLGSTRRAGRGVLPAGTPGGEDEVLRGCGYAGPRRLKVDGAVVERGEDDVVAAVFSLSSAAPHLFGPNLAAFDAELRHLLRDTSPKGLFCERMREIALDVWWPPSMPHRSDSDSDSDVA